RIRSRLEQETFDCILIDAGVRANPNNLLLFEKLINVVHQQRTTRQAMLQHRARRYGCGDKALGVSTRG
ncbi:MAG TPA: hypothetical protein VKB50_09300, partial [Vicinamibacterales bacterium]|nr:hypothetical protein [Vicinamibacterales bacterium]